MTSALKLILKERGLTQTKFAENRGISKQSVSKWILRQKPMHEYHIQYVVDVLKVNREFFVDDRRYCKVLNEKETLELEDYLLKQKFEQPLSMCKNEDDENERIYKEYLDYKYLVEYRHKKVESETRQIIKRLKKDIHDIDSKANGYSYTEILDILDNNISFYERILILRESKNITIDEWECVFKALFMLIAEGTAIHTDELTLDLYNAFTKNRKKKEESRIKDIKFYKDIWGEIPSGDALKDDEKEV